MILNRTSIGGNQRRAVRRECQAGEATVVPVQLPQLLPVARTVECNLAAITRRQEITIWAKAQDNWEKVVSTAAERVLIDQREIGNPANLKCARVAHRQELAVGRKGERSCHVE
ncbi:MAG: hypothetical protein U0232_19735 [Thermomicrobiales bacterium]